MAYHESPSGLSANVYPSSGDINSSISSNSPLKGKPYRTVAARSGRGHPPGAPARPIDPKDPDGLWQYEESSVSSYSPDTSEENDALRRAELARLHVERSRLKAKTPKGKFDRIKADM